MIKLPDNVTPIPTSDEYLRSYHVHTSNGACRVNVWHHKHDAHYTVGLANQPKKGKTKIYKNLTLDEVNRILCNYEKYTEGIKHPKN